MTKEEPPACSLDANPLERRLAAIAEVGADSLTSRAVDDDGRHLLRFRSRAGTRDRLEEIVAAEAECCSFLDLHLSEQGGTLVLSIAAPANGTAVADALAEAFARVAHA
jgi:hypothetical protein